MSVLLATLAINEMEWLPALYEQHKDWPELKSWVFMEAADRVYAESNPQLVNAKGLSIDGTSEFLEELEQRDSRVTYIPHGISYHSDPELCKIQCRQRSMEVAAEVEPEFFIVLDADEFYTKQHQADMIEWMRGHEHYDAFVFLRREIWRPPSIVDQPLMQYEAIGEFWQMACCHWWRWSKGVRYMHCHNSPQRQGGSYLSNKMVRWDRTPNTPQMIHMGYASQRDTRIAKIRYYEERGERDHPKRHSYTECRRAWIDWQPMDRLPFGGRVVPYRGPIPEVFRSE